MRISDWSSDVCSSDLLPVDLVMLKVQGDEIRNAVFRPKPNAPRLRRHGKGLDFPGEILRARLRTAQFARAGARQGARRDQLDQAVHAGDREIGRASCRERGGPYV